MASDSASTVLLHDGLISQSINTCMKLSEIDSSQIQKPLTPQQSQIDALKNQKERATDALKNARVQQQQTKAQDALKQTQQVLSKLS